MDDFEYHGEWWLPTTPEKPVGGVLSFDRQTGGHLKLFDPIINPVDEDGRYTPQTVDTIHGEVREGKDITLRNCQLRIEGETLGKAIRQVCSSELILSGGHFEDEVYFDHISLDLPHLEEWTQIRTIIPQIQSEDGGSIGRYDPLDPIRCHLDDVELILHTTTTWNNKGTRGSEYIQNSEIEIHPHDDRCFEALRPFISRIKEYFSFATNDTIYPESIVGRIERRDEYPPHETNIYYRQPQYSAPRTDVWASSFNFILDDIDFEESLQSWFDSIDSVETFHDLYFSILFENKPHVRYSFLTLIIALEAYFNNTVDNAKLMDKGEYNQAWRQAVDEIPDEIPAKARIRDLLKSGIGNELSLRDKPKHLAHDHEEILSDLIDIETTMKEARDTRHAIAHGLSESDRGSYVRLEPQELWELTKKLQLLVELRLFYAAAVNETTIRGTLTRRYSF